MSDDLRPEHEETAGQPTREQRGTTTAGNSHQKSEHQKSDDETAVGREERLIGAERFARKGDEFDE